MSQSERNPRSSTSKKATDQARLFSKIHLLLIECDREQREIFGRWLGEEGFSLVSVSDLEEAKDKIHTGPFFMIILDIDFPEGTRQGLEICSKLKKDRKTKDIPLIVMTYRTNLDTIIESLDTGAENFILKPFETDYFLERTRHIIAEIEARKKTKRVIDLALLNFVFTLRKTADKENFLRLLCKAFNRTVWVKCVQIMKSDCVMLMVNRAKRVTGKRYAFLNILVTDNHGVAIENLSEAVMGISAATVKEGFKEFVGNFIKILMVLTGNVIVELDGDVNKEKQGGEDH